METYGVKEDQQFHKEVLERYSKLNIAPYKVFINPVLRPVLDGEKIIDVLLEYPDDFMQQMLCYVRNYSFLPNKN